MQGGAIMRISTLAIENYKSLKKISFSPSNFAVLIGANASGKSNFADALEFLGLVYKHGLEHAITAKGGYENIAFRRQRRSKSPISFTISSKTNEKETQLILRRLLPPKSKSFKTSPYKHLIFEHSFSFKATSRGIKADFIISNEYINISGVSKKGIKEKILSIERDEDSHLNFIPQADNDIVKSLLRNFTYYIDFQTNATLQPQSLLLTSATIAIFAFYFFTNQLSHIVTYRFSPGFCRQPGVPTPNPSLSIYGEQLPALIDLLMRKYPDQWKIVLSAMQDLIPELEDISVAILHTKRLGIFFKTSELQRPWTADEMSDGTIQSLAILSSLADPRNFLTLIEEPENSIHPWILNVISEQFKITSKKQTVILTTHSQIIIDKSQPNDIWIFHKKDGETKIERLTDIDKTIKTRWENGEFKLSDLLESGYISQYVPGGIS